jgi:hypothetical protein
VSNDLIRKIVPKPEQKATSAQTKAHTEATEVVEATHALAERMLFGTEPRPQPVQDRPRIILALDCTTSMGEFIEARKITAEVATTMAKALFEKAGRAGLEVQLVYFRGNGDEQSSKQPRQFRVSKKWYTTPEELARAIAAIDHWPGWTQHCRVLRHAFAEAEKQAVQELVTITDAFEERTPLRPEGDDLLAARVHARRLRDLGVKIVAGYKGTIRGGCPLDRAGVSAEQAFQDITDENGGYCFLLNPEELAERFGDVATQAVLVAKGDTAGAQVLLEHLRAVPFEMETNVVGEQVPSAKCER